MNIIDIATYPEAIERCAEWHFNEWGYLYPSESKDDFANELKQSLLPSSIPSTFIAIINDKVIGSISLLAQDMPPNQQHTPWLANLFVHPEHRNKGVGKLLIAHLIEFCQTQQWSKLYLFTPKNRTYYEDQGWQLLTQTTYHDEQVDIMFLPL